MKLDKLVASHVGDSGLDPASVRRFLQATPQYHAWGLTHQIEPTGLTQLAATNLVCYYLRMYLIGRQKTLRACLRETRAFARQDIQAAHYLLVFYLEQIRSTLLGLEWYELLPRLAVAGEQILRLVASGANQARPRLAHWLESAYNPINPNE